MSISRRAFLASLGAGAAAVAFAGIPVPAAEAGTLATSGWSAATEPLLQIGDIFTIEGRYVISPITYKPTKQLQSFIVTAITGESVSMSPYSQPIRNQVNPLSGWSGLKPLHQK